MICIKNNSIYKKHSLIHTTSYFCVLHTSIQINYVGYTHRWHQIKYMYMENLQKCCKSIIKSLVYDYFPAYPTLIEVISERQMHPLFKINNDTLLLQENI